MSLNTTISVYPKQSLTLSLETVVLKIHEFYRISRNKQSKVLYSSALRGFIDSIKSV